MKTQIGGKTCYIYDCGSSDVLLIQPVDDHDIEVLDSEVDEIKRLSGRGFTLAAFKVDDWNADLSPWEAPPVFGNEAFAGGAEATLKYVVKELIPQLKGGKDPDNRRPYPWGRENKKLQAYCRAFIQLRKKFDALRTGRMIPVYAEGDVYIYARSIEGGKDVFGKPAEDGLFFVALNRGAEAHTVRVYTGELAFGELQSIGPVPAGPVSVVNGVFTVTLPPLSQQIYQCAEKHTCGEPAEGQPDHATADNKNSRLTFRKAGILLHPTSLWGENGKEKKEAAKEWIDFLAAAGQKIWQILPLNPPGLGNSPYLSVSAFAGHETLFAGTEENTCGSTKDLLSGTNKIIKKEEQQNSKI